MITFPGSPRLMKGAIIGIDPLNPIASAVVFQYNPDSMTRTLESQISGKDSAKAENLQIKGAPVETIKLDVEIDASDQLENADLSATNLGIYPQLSALEMLIYPKSSRVIENTLLLACGTLNIIHPTAPFTLFVWGTKRVIPVKLTDFTIQEESYDTNLNPLRARVTLGLRVLSYNDFSVTNPGYYVFLAHQIMKEGMAMAGGAGGIADLVNSNIGGSVSLKL